MRVAATANSPPVISGTASASLSGFSISVNPGAATGIAERRWPAPAENTNGTAISDLAGFKVYHGTSVSALNKVVQMADSGVHSHTYSQPPSATHSFGMSASKTTGLESAVSTVGSGAIP